MKLCSPIASLPKRRIPRPPPSIPPQRTAADRAAVGSKQRGVFPNLPLASRTIILMATQSKSQLLNEVHALLKKRYKPKPDRSNGRLSVLEAVIYGVCHEATT